MKEVKNQNFSSMTKELSINQANTRYETLEDKQYLVVPCVMMTEGVHKGSMGSLYYPAKELSKTPAVWNTKPVVVYHPKFNGQSVSACDPIILETYRVGMLMNTKWEDGKLKTECWIDEDKTRKVDDRVIKAIENGLMMEVSTGLFTDNEISEGEWEGKNYTNIARNYRPDHLAILPDLKGACSIEAGAGLLRNEKIEELRKSEAFENFGDSMKALTKFYTDLTSNEDEEKQHHSVDGENIKNGSDSEILSCENKENVMDKQKMVDSLISNEKSPWEETDREHLMSVSDEKLGLIANLSVEKEEVKEEIKEEVKEEKVENKEQNIAENKAMTLNEYIESAPKEMQGMLKAGIEAHTAEKNILIQKITANARNSFSSEQLQGKEINELKQLAQLAEVPVEKKVTAPTFGGQAEVLSNDENKEEPLVAPALTFE